MNEHALLAKLILLQMRQNQLLAKALYHEVSKDRTFGDGHSSLMEAGELLDQAEKLVSDSAFSGWVL